MKSASLINGREASSEDIKQVIKQQINKFIPQSVITSETQNPILQILVSKIKQKNNNQKTTNGCDQKLCDGQYPG